MNTLEEGRGGGGGKPAGFDPRNENYGGRKSLVQLAGILLLLYQNRKLKAIPCFGEEHRLALPLNTLRRHS